MLDFLDHPAQDSHRTVLADLKFVRETRSLLMRQTHRKRTRSTAEKYYEHASSPDQISQSTLQGRRENLPLTTACKPVFDWSEQKIHSQDFES